MIMDLCSAKRFARPNIRIVLRKKQLQEEPAWSKAVNVLPCKNRHIILFWIYIVDGLTVLRLRTLNSPYTL
jgi:hypothetical protein